MKGFALPWRVSYTQLKRTSCLAYWRLRHLARYPEPPSDRLVIGSAVHHGVLERALTQKLDHGVDPGEAFASAWAAYYAACEMTKHGDEMLYLDSAPSDVEGIAATAAKYFYRMMAPQPTIAIEPRWTQELDDVLVDIAPDHLYRQDTGRVAANDLKTQRHEMHKKAQWSQAKADEDMQMAMYGWGICERYDQPETDVTVLVVSKSPTPRLGAWTTRIDADRIASAKAWIREKVALITEAVATNAFPRGKSADCRYCAFDKQCGPLFDRLVQGESDIVEW